MTRKVFWEDPYLTQLETRVTSVNDNDITVEQTIFYALGDGSPLDPFGRVRSRQVFSLMIILTFPSEFLRVPSLSIGLVPANLSFNPFI
jgi:hypothetical protein